VVVVDMWVPAYIAVVVAVAVVQALGAGYSAAAEKLEEIAVVDFAVDSVLVTVCIAAGAAAEFGRLIQLGSNLC
jgi:hypothetical protein